MKTVKNGVVFKTYKGYIKVRKEMVAFGNMATYIYYTDDLEYATVFNTPNDFLLVNFQNIETKVIKQLAEPIIVEIVEIRDVKIKV